MKRKVLRVGNASLAVSLPSKWAKTHQLKPGDELDVTEEQSLIISKEGPRTEKKERDLNIEDFAYYRLSRYLTILYRENYDFVRLRYNKTNIYHDKYQNEENLRRTIKRIANRLIGAEIISQTTTQTEIQFFVGQETRDLHKIELRIRYLFKETMDELLSSLKDFKAFHASNYERHDNISKFINYYLRLLDTSDKTVEEKQAAYALYVILDRMADKLRHISEKVYEYGCSAKLEDFLRQLFDLLYASFSALQKGKISRELIERRYELRRQYEEADWKEKDMKTLAEALPFIDVLKDFAGLIIARDD